MKITKTLGYIAIASFLAFAPMKTYAKEDTITLKIEFPTQTKELTHYVVNLATDIDDDGKPDKQGYETLLDKLGIKHDKNQSIEEYQKQMKEYVDSLQTESQFEEVYRHSSSMFTEKDYDMYLDKAFEIIGEVLEETLKDLLEIEEELNKSN